VRIAKLPPQDQREGRRRHREVGLALLGYFYDGRRVTISTNAVLIVFPPLTTIIPRLFFD
jgi:hypothetical protein